MSSSFSKHENQDDRKNQNQVLDALMAYLSSFPVAGTGLDGISYFAVRETEAFANMPYDVIIAHHGRDVAVAEIKCRNAPYDLDYMITGGMLVTSDTLNKLRKQHKLGKHVLLVTRTSDHHILFITMQTLLDNRDKLKTKGHGCIKDNHGKADRKGTGTIIPFSLLTEIPA